MTLDQTIDGVAKARTALVLTAREDDSAALDLAIGRYFTACSLFLQQMTKARSKDAT